MSGPTDLLRQARQRAVARRDAYRSAGLWTHEPVDVVRSAAERAGERLALIDRTGEITYAELDRRVDAACGGMAQAGVDAETPIVVVVGNDVDSVIAVHAALRRDAVVLLVPRSAGSAQVGDILARTGAAIGTAPNWPQVSELSGRC